MFERIEPSMAIISIACLFAGIALSIAGATIAEISPVMAAVTVILSRLSLVMLVVMQWVLGMLFISRLELSSDQEPPKSKTKSAKTAKSQTVASRRGTKEPTSPSTMRLLLAIFGLWSGVSLFFWAFHHRPGMWWIPLLFASVAVFFFSMAWKELLTAFSRLTAEKTGINITPFKWTSSEFWLSLISLGVYWFFLQYQLLKTQDQFTTSDGS